ncbi:MAG: Hsp70 family protein [Deferrisomatales bacterium]
MDPRFAVGIDLGTSNSALAVAAPDDRGPAQVVPIPQLFSPESVGEQETLPSVLYLPPEAEAAGISARLPWGPVDPQRGVVGRFAREKGVLVPDRLVTSAKSWLCTPHVDPAKPVLPWGSGIDPHRKVSALEASTRYLAHLLEALRRHLREHGGGGRPENCEVVLTVPASFDEVARAQTHRAAAEAGWGEVTLLEEQQAAFYHWIAQSGDRWREEVSAGDLVLVCDVGGGTADFSLVAVSERDGELALERVSVGDHILLGGDNMDLALAYRVRSDLEAAGTRLDNWQFLSLIHSCRLAKEALFADPALDEHPISVPSRGAGLFAGTVSAALSRTALEEVVVEGFFPRTPVHDHPTRRRRAGLAEFGLDYASDPALSKHLAYFLARSWQNAASDPALQALVGDRVREAEGVSFVCPTAVLCNGGVFQAEPLRRRLLELLARWSGGAPIRELAGSHLDLAVAQGAAVYARTRATGEGIRIKAGTARSYYIGLETSMPAVPGMAPPVKAVCVAPQGMEEGSEARLPGQEFGLITGEQVEFRFFSSSVRAGDAVGAVVDDVDELEETASLEVTLPPLEGRMGEMIPVRLHSVVTELGTLELWMHHEQSARRWKVEFNVRER